MIKVIVAEDSHFMRKFLIDVFDEAPDFDVVDTAMNGKEAIEKILKYKPDVVTMDINMPIMDGLAALEVIMKDCPVPVVMFSSLTQEGSEATYKALSLGAVDFMAKTMSPLGAGASIKDELLNKCRAAARSNLHMLRKPLPKPPEPRPLGQKHIELPLRAAAEHAKQVALSLRKQIKPISEMRKPAVKSSLGKLVVLGTSTGGPKALQRVIPMLPKDLPCGVLIVQHMPEGFTKTLAAGLNEISQISVKEAENHDIIEEGHAYIAPGNYHMVVEKRAGHREIVLNQDPPIGTLRPAADILFNSAAKFGKDVVSVILTGIGNDGAEGMKNIKDAGGFAIAEDESTAVVYGMPKAVAKLGLPDRILPLDKIAEAIVHAVK